MTDPRAALEALANKWDDEALTAIENGLSEQAVSMAWCAGDLRAALATPAPEPERCAFRGCDQQPCTHECPTAGAPEPHEPFVSCHPFTPAPEPERSLPWCRAHGYRCSGEHAPEPERCHEFLPTSHCQHADPAAPPTSAEALRDARERLERILSDSEPAFWEEWETRIGDLIAAARQPWTVEPEALARLFHETYERLAPDFGYETRRESAVPWEQVPDNNRRLMVAVAAVIVAALTHDPQGREDPKGEHGRG